MKVDQELIRKCVRTIHGKYPNGNGCHIEGQVNQITDYYLTRTQLQCVTASVTRRLESGRIY